MLGFKGSITLRVPNPYSKATQKLYVLAFGILSIAQT